MSKLSFVCFAQACAVRLLGACLAFGFSLTTPGIALSGLALAASSAAADELPADARDVLDRFVGKWDTEASFRAGAENAEVKKTAGRGLCTVTLEGRYYEFRTATVPAGESELQIMTYDPVAKLFKQWIFASDGYSHAADGAWDAATSTLRWTGKSGENSLVIEDRFVAPDRLEWTLTRSNAAGEVVQTITGVLRRVPE